MTSSLLRLPLVPRFVAPLVIVAVPLACGDGTSASGGAPRGDTPSSVSDGDGAPDAPPSTVEPGVPPQTQPAGGTPVAGDPGAPTGEAPPSDIGLDDGAGNMPAGGNEPPAPGGCIIPVAGTGPIGYGAATTGGGDAPAVIVTSFAEAEAALEAYRDAFKDGTESALVLRYTGEFDFASITDVCAQHTKDAQTLEVKEMENVTIEGATGSSANFGIHINRAKNVIVRNMRLGLLPGGGDSDAITIEGNGENGDVENVWIDHNELFSSTKDDCDGAGDTEFDGLIDIKKGARRITVSFNHLHDHQKTGLLGHSDDDEMERFVTFHHNLYENVVSRTPLQRFGFIHLFNNYYTQISGSGINVRMGGIALIEANSFDDVANPITSRFSDVAGFWELRNNRVGENITWTVEEDTLANADDWQSTATSPAGEPSYAYTPDDAACVEQIVRATAGATL